MDESRLMWVVGKFIKSTDEGSVWEMSGVFDEEQDAIGACISENYFIGPILKNTPTKDECQGWPGVYYPHFETRVD
jgi:hypothetical protein